MDTVKDWLTSGPPWVEYRSRVELIDEGENTPAVQSARERMIDHPRVQGILEELASWPGAALRVTNLPGIYCTSSHSWRILVFVWVICARESDRSSACPSI